MYSINSGALKRKEAETFFFSKVNSPPPPCFAISN